MKSSKQSVTVCMWSLSQTDWRRHMCNIQASPMISVHSGPDMDTPHRHSDWHNESCEELTVDATRSCVSSSLWTPVLMISPQSLRRKTLQLSVISPGRLWINIRALTYHLRVYCNCCSTLDVAVELPLKPLCSITIWRPSVLVYVVGFVLQLYVAEHTHLRDMTRTRVHTFV